MPPSEPPLESGTNGADFDALAPDELDRLEGGVIALDEAGTIVAFSDGASDLLKLPREAVLGRDYFQDVMPAANVPAFRGRFLAGARRGSLDERFEYVFGRLPQPLRAQVQMRRGAFAGNPVTWLRIEAMETLGYGARRDAVVSAIGRRVRAEPVDPSLCEREPIHIPGSIQPNAVLFAADAATLLVTAFSTNVTEVVDLSDPPLLGRPLGDVLPASYIEAVKVRLANGTLDDGRSLRRRVRFPERSEAGYLAVAHLHAGRLIVEIEREPDIADDFRLASQTDTELAVARLSDAETLVGAARVAAAEIRALTGFEAVLVYRFDSDWNGEAVAEDKAPNWSRSLLGLRFPASDIPAQARALYTKAKSRFVIDRDSVPVALVGAPGTDNAPIDLTFAQHRSLSPIHLEYQRNLGVNGSMSISIMVDGRLWGLMIGHHRRPHYVPPETRAAATVLTDAFAMRVQEIESRRLWAERQAHLDVEGRLVRSLTRSDDFVSALTGGVTTLLHLFDSTGAGIVSGERATLIGRAPPAEAVLEIAAWLRETVPQDQTCFESSNFTTAYPAAGPYREVASGLLAAFVDDGRETLLMWFRPEMPSTVTWGGDPRKPVLAGSGSVAVLPRRSFERWVEERTGHANPWAEWQSNLAVSLAEAVEGVVLRQRRKIDELTGLLAEKERLLAQKDLLSREIDHRVKNSLQIVSAFLQMQRRQIADAAARQAFAETSARVMSVARVHDSLYQADRVDEVDLGVTIESLCKDLAGLAGDGHSVDLTVERGMMVPYRKAVALSLIATELVTNAFKYASTPTGGGRVEVTVSSLNDEGGVQLKVCDDGGGLPDGWAEPKSNGQGSGLGMKLIRAMLDQINARLDVVNNPGACFTITA
ncbi:histidine kinase dimerization/phosphoacceptor domain -containing protein [Methylobacterium sp. NFXW15]|uniref:histidine kinase dimerization/phosphoacceptor domain -containing protein n=1 Tax=Methylobacterium sp. NFXW15 TaxID=2819512 RepID=UPI003CF0B318